MADTLGTPELAALAALEETKRRGRRRAFWRGALVAGVVVGLIAAALSAVGALPRGPHIARLSVSQVIVSNPARETLVADLAEDDTVRALVLHIDSPGGTVVASEALYLGLRDVAASKPLVVVMGGVAASGGYMAALAGEHVFARGNTITGSIGVILEYVTVSGLMDRLGLSVETIRSSDLKAGPSPLRPLTPEARAAEAAVVDDTYAWFSGLVAERRGLAGDALDRVADGRTFTGRMAEDAGLVDAIGGEAEALVWLRAEYPELEDLPVETWEVPSRETGVLPFLARLTGLGPALPKTLIPDGPRLMSILR
ncbi:MAG: signal peptide peptidase SppA [Pseudomonadota bacterium]